MTRRLVDVSQDAVIIEEDCGTDRALEMRAIVQGGAVIASLDLQPGASVTVREDSGA